MTSQDGAYLDAFLLEKGYEVHGIKRRSSSRLVLHYGDLTDATNLIRIFHAVQPDEVYDLGAQSHIQDSFETPKYSVNADAMKQRRGRKLLLEPEDERGHCRMYATRHQARADVLDYIKCFHNSRCQHSTLSYASQAHIEQQRCV